MKIGVIIGSTRENRKSILIGKWVLQTVNKPFSIIDIRDFNLPHYNEPMSPMSKEGYVYNTTKTWSKEINQYDGFIFVTPEYNGYITGALKDAIDYLYSEWEGKPYAIVSYGGRGGKWAAEGLEKLLSRFDMSCLGKCEIHQPWLSISKDGTINPEYIYGDLLKIVDDFHL